MRPNPLHRIRTRWRLRRLRWWHRLAAWLLRLQSHLGQDEGARGLALLTLAMLLIVFLQALVLVVASQGGRPSP